MVRRIMSEAHQFLFFSFPDSLFYASYTVISAIVTLCLPLTDHIRINSQPRMQRRRSRVSVVHHATLSSGKQLHCCAGTASSRRELPFVERLTVQLEKQCGKPCLLVHLLRPSYWNLRKGSVCGDSQSILLQLDRRALRTVQVVH